MILRILILLIIGHSTFSQVRITGVVLDDQSHEAIAYVNIGIKEKNIGTTSSEQGTFSISIPSDLLNDTLTFSMVGYHELNVPIPDFHSKKETKIRLSEKVITLNELVVPGKKFVERKYGIKRRGLIHFTDGMFNKDDSFEIGQRIKLGKREVQITSVNLHINASRSDSANFRINFYRYDDDNNIPAERIVEKSVLQRHPIREGWLKFDLSAYNILLKGKVLVSIEFIPEQKEGIKQIYYEVKIGGSSKSFYRRSSLGKWNMPPHHYCMYVTAMVDKDTPVETEEDEETIPTIILKSTYSKEPYSIFIRLPKGYHSNSKKKYPVVYHLDGNAFFDHITSSVSQLSKKKKISVDPIIVGIGYENAYVMDSLRARDYTFPEALPTDSFHISGGAERFYDFIKTKVVPYIQMNYRTDTTSRTIMGHSLGGYFVLYSLLKDIEGEALFNNYVAASPSISYSGNYILKRFQDLTPENKDKMKFKLYVTAGQLEIDEDPTDTFDNFVQTLSSQELIQLKYKVYEQLEHLGTAVPSFEDGLAFVLNP